MKGYVHFLLTACLSLVMPMANGQTKAVPTKVFGGSPLKANEPVKSGPVTGSEMITPEARVELLRKQTIVPQEGITPSVTVPTPTVPRKPQETAVKVSNTTVKQTMPGKSSQAKTMTRPSAANPVDERPLWALLSEKRYDDLDRAIINMQSRYPRWSPPVQLISLRDEAQRRERISEATVTQNDAALIEFSRLYPMEFDCQQVNNAWLLADAYRREGQPQSAIGVYESLMTSCSKPEDRMATLYKASEWVNSEEFDRLAQRELGRHDRPAHIKAELSRFLYGKELARLAAVFEEKRLDDAVFLADQLSDQTRVYQDGGGANLLGWVYYQAGQYDRSLDWFNLAVQWNPMDPDAVYGLALNQFSIGDIDGARSTLLNDGRRSMNSLDERSRALIGEIYFSKAITAYQKRQYRKTDVFLGMAQRSGKTDAALSEIRGWLAFSIGQYDDSIRIFEHLYRQNPTPDYAEGLALSLERAGRTDRLLAVRQELNGPIGAIPLVDVWDDFDRYYPKKVFIAAYHADPHRLSALHNIDSPSLTLGGVFRERKSRDDAPFGLRSWRFPVAEGVFTWGNVSLRAGADRVHLWRTGNVDASFPIGHMPAQRRRFDYTPTRSVTSYEPYIGIRKEGELTVDATIGASARKKPLDQEIIWNLMVRHFTDRGYIQGDFYRQPVRESLLSYSGMIDPYTGKTWGQVLRLGGALSGYWQLGSGPDNYSDWGISAKVGYEHLKGTDVQSNSHVFASLGLGKDLKLDGFDYFTVGPEVSFETYQKNLSHFTWGHGGYYSPKAYVNVGPAINFLTDEGQSFIYKGRLAVGYAYSKEKSVPYFPGSTEIPLSELARGRYYSNSNTRAGVSGELLGVHRVGSHTQVGGGIGFALEPKYKEYTGMLFVRFFLDRRPATFSSDLGESMFRRAY